MVTGQAAVRRTRGGNFTGLEVAHIFPLMAVGNVIAHFAPHLLISLFLTAARLDKSHVSGRPATSTYS
jgi:hypothetical protein